MEKSDSDARERILCAAADLFAEKGYEVAKMNEIALSASVTKGLIYHYFEGKQAILDHLIRSFFDEVKIIGIRFIRERISQMIHEGTLDIQGNRPCFSSAEAEASYRREMHRYYVDLLDYLLYHKRMLRILLSEALRKGEQHDALLRFFLISEGGVKTPMHKELSDLDPDVYYTDDIVFLKFFFSLLPMLNYIVFEEDYRTVSGLSFKETRQMFVRALEEFYFGDLVGQGVWIL